jgi:hypothetical protein
VVGISGADGPRFTPFGTKSFKNASAVVEVAIFVAQNSAVVDIHCDILAFFGGFNFPCRHTSEER